MLPIFNPNIYLNGGLVLMGLFLGSQIFESILNVVGSTSKTFDKIQEKNELEGFTIVDVKKLEVGKEVIIKVPEGYSFTDLTKVTEEIEKAFKCKALLENIPYSNKLKATLITNPIVEVEQPKVGHKLRIPVGFDVFGRHIYLDMTRNAGLLINGVPGVGKSVLIKQIQDYVSNNGAKCYYVQLVKSDLKKLGVEVYDELAEIDRVISEILALAMSCTNGEVIYIFIDEFSFLNPFKGDVDSKLKESIINSMSRLLRICRSELIRPVISTQKVVSEFLPTSISSMLECKLTFKCGDESSSKMVVGDSEATELLFREFILVDSEGKRRGKTYKDVL